MTRTAGLVSLLALAVICTVAVVGHSVGCKATRAEPTSAASPGVQETWFQPEELKAVILDESDVAPYRIEAQVPHTWPGPQLERQRPGVQQSLEAVGRPGLHVTVYRFDDEKAAMEGADHYAHSMAAGFRQGGLDGELDGETIGESCWAHESTWAPALVFQRGPFCAVVGGRIAVPSERSIITEIAQKLDEKIVGYLGRAQVNDAPGSDQPEASQSSAELNSTDPQRWDLCMIREAPIWNYLVVKYGYADHIKYWPERKAALQTIVNEFPDSRWADDAALILACGKAGFEGDTAGAITALRKVMQKYPKGQTVVSYWSPDIGCIFDSTWLMWAPGLASLNPDRSIRWSRSFDKYGGPSQQEREALTYFNHLEKYPKFTVDVAQCIIAQILSRQGDHTAAIAELEAIIGRHPDLATVNTADRVAASKADGYLIGHESVESPVWRPEYFTYLLLMNSYEAIGQNDKAVASGLALAGACSADGWYWNVNRRVGDVCKRNNRLTEAEKQYQLALQGCRQFITNRIARKKVLDELGFIVKSPNFVSWEHMVLEREGWDKVIAELEALVLSAKTKMVPEGPKNAK